MKDGVIFKMVGDKVELSTSQILDKDELVKRIISIEAQRTNFTQQLESMKFQIEEANKNIEILKKNMIAATDDLDKAYKFLKDNKLDDLETQIKTKVEENKKQLAMNPQMGLQ
jgi:seryl-tRNA synthetase